MLVGVELVIGKIAVSRILGKSASFLRNDLPVSDEHVLITDHIWSDGVGKALIEGSSAQTSGVV